MKQYTFTVKISSERYSGEERSLDIDMNFRKSTNKTALFCHSKSIRRTHKKKNPENLYIESYVCLIRRIAFCLNMSVNFQFQSGYSDVRMCAAQNGDMIELTILFN